MRYSVPSSTPPDSLTQSETMGNSIETAKSLPLPSAEGILVQRSLEYTQEEGTVFR